MRQDQLLILQEGYLRSKTLKKAEEKTEEMIDGVVELIEKNPTLESKKLVIMGGAILAKEISEAELQKDPARKEKLLRRALRDARALRNKAYGISDDTIVDYGWSVLTKPWWRTFWKYGRSYLRDGKVDNTSREGALGSFDVMTRFIEHEIDSLNKKKSEE